MPIGTGDGEFFDDEFHYQAEGFTPGPVNAPIPTTDSFQPGPKTSTITGKNLTDYPNVGLDVQNIPDGMDPKDFIRQLNQQKPVIKDAKTASNN